MEYLCICTTPAACRLLLIAVHAIHWLVCNGLQAEVTQLLAALGS